MLGFLFHYVAAYFDALDIKKWLLNVVVYKTHIYSLDVYNVGQRGCTITERSISGKLTFKI